jgi:sarcosine reductase
MMLSLSNYNITGVKFAEKTEIRSSVLFVNPNELRSYLLADKNFSDVVIDIAHPGEMTRIINVLDIVDPRKKAGEESEVFPGWIGKFGSAGWGRTKVLRGVSIIETGHMQGFFGGIIDMGGLGSVYSPYSKTHNVVLAPTPSKEVDPIQFAKSLKMAALKASVYLGKATLNLPPEEMVNIDFTPRLGKDKQLGLPRVGYIWHVLSHYRLREIYYHGANSNNFYPILITPNEIFDGAVVSGHYDHSPGLKNYTHSILNHPVVMELCKRHGKELDFAGIILANEPSETEGKKWNASINAKIAKSILDLDGVVITKEGGGHTDFDLMEVCKQCEHLGIKTALIDIEMLDQEGEGDYPLIVFDKEADAVVSAGNIEERITISKMDRVIGGIGMKEIGGDPKSENKIPIWLVSGAISEIGMSKIRGKLF